jgi:hypothetical protein
MPAIPGSVTEVIADPARFDTIAYLPKATALARRVLADAELTSFHAAAVRPDGTSDLTLFRDADVVYMFRSPASSGRPAGVPRGADVEIRCMVYVRVDRTGSMALGVTHQHCNDPLRPAPRCSLRRVWELARARGAPAGDWVAKIAYLRDGYFVDIADGEGEGEDFTESFGDPC